MSIAKAKTDPGHGIRGLTDIENHAGVYGSFVVPENVTVSGTGSGADAPNLRDHTLQAGKHDVPRDLIRRRYVCVRLIHP